MVTATTVEEEGIQQQAVGVNPKTTTTVTTITRSEIMATPNVITVKKGATLWQTAEVDQITITMITTTTLSEITTTTVIITTPTIITTPLEITHHK